MDTLVAYRPREVVDINNNIKNHHPCFSMGANVKNARIHLPVSPFCNIHCKFCKRSFNKTDCRPGVSSKILSPKEALSITRKAVNVCPELSVAGIAGPGDALASPHALETFRLLNESFGLINCLSTNGLLLEQYALDLWEAGVRTVTVTVNAVDAKILTGICTSVFMDGKLYEGFMGADLLINAQRRGIEKMSRYGAIIKINTVLIPGVNDSHIWEIAQETKLWGASLMNIIPLIPQHEMAEISQPSCSQLNAARLAAENHLPVFRHCSHCRADACGIPGKSNISDLLYGYAGTEQTFSHG